MEKRQNYSRKREAILSTIRNTTTHPTAEWVYQTLKPEYPDLSLGTVYRNIAQFKNDGKIISVGVVNGQERFDGNTHPHSHFVCMECGNVLDIPGEFIGPKANKQIAREFGMQVYSCEVIFHGMCPACLKKQQEN